MCAYIHINFFTPEDINVYNMLLYIHMFIVVSSARFVYTSLAFSYLCTITYRNYDSIFEKIPHNVEYGVFCLCYNWALQQQSARKASKCSEKWGSEI